MNLRYGRGCQGLRIKCVEQIIERVSQFGFNGLPGVRKRKRWNMILKLRQIGRYFLAKEILPGGERLAQFDKAWAQFLERAGQSLARSTGSTPSTRQRRTP